ncbi:MAG: DUF2490 domain-containing protein [Tannerellaceae bacterium]|nr:DUF2490 domain-containing protein [Tannerellaceae bacterium]
MNYLRFILFSILLLPGTSLLGQNDFGSSLSIDLSKKILPGLTASLEEEFRMREDLGKADRFSTTLDLNYKVRDFFKVGGAYNLINYNHDKRGWEVRHRYYVYATGSYRVNRFIFFLRERFQSTYRAGVSATAKRANPKSYLRSRLKGVYDIRKSSFSPYASMEFYNTLNDPQENKMNKFRVTGGTDYKLNKRNALEIYYRYTNFIDDDDINGKHMIGIGYSHRF